MLDLRIAGPRLKGKALAPHEFFRLFYGSCLYEHRPSKNAKRLWMETRGLGYSLLNPLPPYTSSKSCILRIFCLEQLCVCKGLFSLFPDFDQLVNLND